MTLFLMSVVLLILWAVWNCIFGSKKDEVDEIAEKIDALSDEDVHDLLATLTKRLVILNWYDKEHLSSIVERAIGEDDWEVLVRRQEELADATNDLTREWSTAVLDKMASTPEEEEGDDETQKTLEEVLFTLSNNQLRMYAGVTSTNKTKAELVGLILQHFQNNMKKVVDRKLERIASLLR
jgi:hypothetical protein